MKERIESLLLDGRLDYLMVGSEFCFAVYRLKRMLTDLLDPEIGEISTYDEDYIKRAEHWIERIRIGFVDGQFVPSRRTIEKEEAYIEYPKKHIENIGRHWDYGYVDGRLVPYRRVIKKTEEVT